MSTIMLKTKKENVPDSTILAIASELKNLWISYETGRCKYIGYSEGCDKVFMKYKITKEAFNAEINRHDLTI